MRIAIVCFIPQLNEVLLNSCNGAQTVEVSGIKFVTGKYHGKEIVIATYSGDDFDGLVSALKNELEAKLVIFVGTAISQAAHLKAGDLVVVSEAIKNRGLASKQVYQADNKLIDTAFAVLESLAPDMTVKTVVGKLTDDHNKLLSYEHSKSSQPVEHTVSCLNHWSTKQAQAAVNIGLPFFMVGMLTGSDGEDNQELSKDFLQDVITQIYWLIKGIVEHK